MQAEDLIAHFSGGGICVEITRNFVLECLAYRHLGRTGQKEERKNVEENGK